ncbi:MAG: hypothetical protein WC668_04725 [Patescibacteria group bacterium]|jgi:hypothetical protein
MKEYGPRRVLHVRFINDGEGDIKDFNNNGSVLRIADETFLTAMKTLGEKLGRADLDALRCDDGSVLLTDPPCFGGTIKVAERCLTEADIFFQKIPRIPKAEELSEYIDNINGCRHLFKPLPFGYGYRYDYACLEIGVQLGTVETMGALATIYRVRRYRQEFVGDKNQIVAGEIKYGHRNAPRDLIDVFGCCLLLCQGNIKKAQQMSGSSYVKWGIHDLTKKAFNMMREEAAKTA